MLDLVNRLLSIERRLEKALATIREQRRQIRALQQSLLAQRGS